MRLAAIAPLTLAIILAAGPSIAQPADGFAVPPFNQGVLALTLGHCFDEGLAAGGKSQIDACRSKVEAMYNEIDALRSDPRMRYYIWNTCSDVAGYPAYPSAATLRLFGVCNWRMMDRCSQGLGDGIELDPVQCMRSIRSMGWADTNTTPGPAAKRR